MTLHSLCGLIPLLPRSSDQLPTAHVDPSTSRVSLFQQMSLCLMVGLVDHSTARLKEGADL